MASSQHCLSFLFSLLHCSSLPHCKVALLWTFHRLHLASGHLHLLQSGVWVEAYLLHHGLSHRLQWNLCSSASFADLGVCSIVSLSFSLHSSHGHVEDSLFLKYVFPKEQPLWLTDSAVPYTMSTGANWNWLDWTQGSPGLFSLLPLV